MATWNNVSRTMLKDKSSENRIYFMTLTMKENIDLYREKMIKVQKLVLGKSNYV